MSNVPTQRYEDAVILMEMFRMARDGGYTTAAQLKKAIREAFPDEPPERLERILKDMVRRCL